MPLLVFWLRPLQVLPHLGVARGLNMTRSQVEVAGLLLSFKWILCLFECRFQLSHSQKCRNCAFASLSFQPAGSGGYIGMLRMNKLLYCTFFSFVGHDWYSSDVDNKSLFQFFVKWNNLGGLLSTLQNVWFGENFPPPCLSSISTHEEPIFWHECPAIISKICNKPLLLKLTRSVLLLMAVWVSDLSGTTRSHLLTCTHEIFTDVASTVTFCVQLQEEVPRTAYRLSLKLTSQIADTVLTGRKTLPNQSPTDIAS